jgi:hypothetical protein
MEIKIRSGSEYVTLHAGIGREGKGEVCLSIWIKKKLYTKSKSGTKPTSSKAC